MPDPAASLSELPRLALETYREEYRDLSETWRALDTKAQGQGGIAGIFLAALFAWARDLPAAFGGSERFLVISSILVLVAAIVGAVFAMQVRSVAAPPLGEETAGMVRDILRKQKPEELSERLAAFYNDQIASWKDTNEDMRGHIESKAARIQFAQGALLLAAVLVSMLSIAAMLKIR